MKTPYCERVNPSSGFLVTTLVALGRMPFNGLGSLIRRSLSMPSKSQFIVVIGHTTILFSNYYFFQKSSFNKE